MFSRNMFHNWNSLHIRLKNAYILLSGAMVNRTVKTARTNLPPARLASVARAPSSATITTAPNQRTFAMASMTAVMAPTNETATLHVPSWSSSAGRTAAASSAVGSAMVIQIARTARMRTPPCATEGRAIRRPSSRARTGGAYRSCGCAISTTIAVMTRTSQLTCAGRGIARQGGSDAQAGLTTGKLPQLQLALFGI